MTGNAAGLVRFATGLSGLVVLGWFLSGHAAQPAQDGLPTDWSHRHLVFSRPATAEQLARVSEDPRYWQQLRRQEQSRELSPEASGPASVRRQAHRRKGPKGLWEENLGDNASVGAGNFPATFTLSSTEASCSADYVVYSTGLTASSSQPSLVAFNNLYSGCTGTVPSVNWAYNTDGQILTSPLISQDGKQVAFVQTNSGFGILVVLKWAASSGTLSNPVTPQLVSPGSYSTCTAPCGTFVLLQDGSGTPTDDTTSSVFYDYAHDIAWVGGADGWLHKITGVFKGAPSEVASGGFPVQVNSATDWISSPVYDKVSKNVFVGDSDGYLYRVNSSTGAVITSDQLDFGAGIVDGPIVDSANGFVYVFASSDGSSNCDVGTAACSAVYQLTTAFPAGNSGTEVTVGNSVAYGTLPNPSPMYIGAFDSAYFNSANATGNLYVCGDTGGNAMLYQIPITAGAMPLTGEGLAITALAAASSTVPCSPVADVPNPNTTGGFSERLFVGVQDNGVPSVCGSAGCLANFVSAPWYASTVYAVGQQILSTKLHIETVITGGTSAATPPIWTSTAGATKTDGSVVWIDQGFLSATTTSGWIASHPYAARSLILDTHGNIQVTISGGTSGGSTPSWQTTPGAPTTDGTITWTNAGAVPTLALASSGGTSGVIIDNSLNGALAGTSQIYFSTLGNQTCTTSGSSGGCAVQASQSALQ